jgi:hypothetical protein
VSAARRDPKGMRRSTGPQSTGATPMTNRSAKSGTRSSLHYGGEGDLILPTAPRCVRAARYGRPVRDPRKARGVSGGTGGSDPISQKRRGKQCPASWRTAA